MKEPIIIGTMSHAYILSFAGEHNNFKSLCFESIFIKKRFLPFSQQKEPKFPNQTKYNEGS